MIKSVFSLYLRYSKWINSENVPWAEGVRSFLQRAFSGSTCLDPLPSWEMCGVSGEDEADFEESSPCLGIVERDPIIQCLQKIL